MLGARLRGLAAVATALAAMGLVAAAMARPGAGDEPPTPKSPEVPKAEMKRPGPRTPKAILSADRDAKEAPAGEVRYAGRVLDPDGKPIAGARVYVPTRIYHDEERPASTPPQLRATTGPEGRFDFAIPEAEFDKTWGNEPWKASTVIAQADGFGPGLASWTADEMTLRLPADDTPIEGRLLDIQGRPVAGATVSVVGLLWNVEGDLTPFLDALQKEQEAYPVQYRMLKWWNDDSLSHLLPAVKSGDDGRFVIKGIGRERVASLWIEGPTIETTFVHARTRPGEMLQIPDFGRQNFGGKVVYYGASSDQVVGPTRPVVGTVRDKDTGKPLAAVTVQTTTAMGNPLRYVKTKTDEQGRYRLTGLPIGKGKYGDGQEVTALPPKEAPYIQVVHPLDEGTSLSPVTRDFDLKRGVWIEGRVIDGATGKPVRARLDYFVYADNPHRQDYPGFGTNRVGMPLTTDAEGRFQIAGIPGKGILGARAEEKYRLGAGKDTLEGLEMLGDAEAVARTYPSFCIPTNYHVVAMVDPPADAESATVDLMLDPGKTIPGRVVGPDGEPVEGASLYGLTDHFRYWQGASGSTFEVLSMAPDEPRLVQARHESKKLAGSVVATADGESPLTLRLAPWGTLTGRIVDDAGQPRAGLELTSDGIDHETGAMPDRVKIDADGRFRVDGIVPGLKYTLQVWDGKTVVGSVGGGVVVAPGETKDLGDVEAKAREAGE
jgi:protocatechuate 3,4-dioxygenase beta subunit/5-hydroxyisourate hydrolase-like protein (transthyretin family)